MNKSMRIERGLKMSKIIAQYILSVMDDGQISTVQIPLPVLNNNDIGRQAFASSNNVMMDLSVPLSEEPKEVPVDWEDPEKIDISTLSIDPEITHVREIQLAGTSARIKQMILVLHFVGKIVAEDKHIDMDRATTQAINCVAKLYNVAYPTVADKLTRQAGLNMSELKTLIAKYFSKEDLAIKDLMTNIVGTRSKAVDETVINDFFDYPNARLLVGDKRI